MTPQGRIPSPPLPPLGAAAVAAIAATSRIDLRPGKFQGEPLYVREYWDKAVAGLADVELQAGGTLVSCFELTADDWALHAGLRGVPVLAVWEDGEGCVNHRVMTAEDFEAVKREAEGEDLPEPAREHEIA